MQIKSAAVLGAGIMGSTIAAHLANVGIPTYLLDIVPRELTEKEKSQGLTMESPAVRNRLAAGGKQALLKAKPAPLYSKTDVELINVGNFEDDLKVLGEVDWIIEVVVENLAIKKKLFARVDEYRKPGTIVSSNTSGISINAMIEDMPQEFKEHFLGTHFFNPPRYMKLLEIIPAKETKQEVVDFMMHFGERVLGKGVVLAKDTPNFIANRIGTYGLIATAKEMQERGLSISQVDAITGPAMGRPKSASFRTLDMVGLDTFVHVANNVVENTDSAEEKAAFDVPKFMLDMVDKKWLGDKSGQGFYRKERTPKGKQILEIDYNSMDYKPKEKAGFASLEAAKAAPGSSVDKLKMLIYGKDEAAKFAWETAKKALLYTAAKIPEIADDIVSIDKAMKWGFNWKMGPFETWDAIGVEKSVERMKQDGEDLPPLVEKLLAKGYKSFYKKDEGRLYYFDLESGGYKPTIEKPEIIQLKEMKKADKVIKANSGASLIDMGDGVACLEFHSPNNAIGADIVQMINYAVEEVEKNYEGLVVGNQGKNFCVGANLMLLLMEAQDDNWDDINFIVKGFQDACMTLKYSQKPVVAAPFAMTLGGGCEVMLGSHRVRAAAETYIGQVESGVGLIPGGGGNKEVLIRYTEGVTDPKADLQPYVNKAFEMIAMSKVATSAKEAQDMNLLRDTDKITVNQDYLLYDAKQTVLAMAQEGFEPLRPKKLRVVGETGYAALKLGAYTMREGGFISAHDEKIANKISYVLTGGSVPANTLVTEQYLLDLEREAFLSLCGEPKSQERMMHMLKTGKPLRN
ncbi:3-hydroxyacyl-CoA dehydrogenase NAD-binding domain-containing protein [Metallumcola ferriviriculae]|uniref:3-hydroxyacyl-CoA dehydrogenase NAD-binding domain-containing protein n=2 Tax=Metallumcola ferriviriculae TaxID=3039180 RepID=A0AAU0UNC9_9FIRM|nr:3-hydroxyacyl-CoA dehydrogenase NAD-binding domain-containing protein [Desulfitibacteraceae bacterium MK1]